MNNADVHDATVGTCDPSGTGSFVTTDKGVVSTVARHDFDFRLTVPSVWLVEHSPKATMEGGQVFYSTPGGNAFFVSFGNLTELTKRFGTLDDYRDASIARIRAQADVSGRLVVSKELRIRRHRAILSNFKGITGAGGVADVWSLDLWCDVKDRYYSLYGDVVRSEEFQDFPSLFESTAQSLVCHEPPPGSSPRLWEWADLGFNTKSKVWFLELFNHSGLIEAYQASEIVLKGGSASQYQWPQRGERPLWHVRERMSARDLGKIGYDERGTLVVEPSMDARPSEQVPEVFDSITYAYSLADARGFVEFREGDGAVLKKIEGRWISVENLTHRTVGTYPNIRLSARREDIGSITVTDAHIVIRGKTGSPSR
ncbi:MAG: hypothetical protein OK474_03590 [Thaumarchaeota archaeon]|nr:hypothetical protein [Nitrososphaerota archaeon]